MSKCVRSINWKDLTLWSALTGLFFNAIIFFIFIFLSNTKFESCQSGFIHSHRTVRLFNINHTAAAGIAAVDRSACTQNIYVLLNECCLRRQSRRHFFFFDARANIRSTCVSIAQTFAVCLVVYASQFQRVLSVRWICQVLFNRWAAAAPNNNIQVYFHPIVCTKLRWRKSSTKGNRSVIRDH